jgi:hypothetical protein|nr:MAG TPA: hypothetical protein [Caudoviricetes sp.]
MKVLTDINMNNNEIIQVIIHKVSSDPTVSAKNAGMIIFNTTDKKLKYYDGSEWVIIGTGSGGTITIDTSLSDSSTNSNAAGSKAVVDYVKNSTKDFNSIVNAIKAVNNGEVLKSNSSTGAIIGIKIDETVKENSENLISSGAVFKAINDSLDKINKADYTCPVITGQNGTCIWTISLEHTNPVFVQVYDSSGEVVFPNIKDYNNQIIITFNGINGDRISAGTYHAVVLFSN